MHAPRWKGGAKTLEHARDGYRGFLLRPKEMCGIALIISGIRIDLSSILVDATSPPPKSHQVSSIPSSITHLQLDFYSFIFFKLIRLCTFWNSGWSFLWMISKQHWGGEVLIAWVPISFCFTQTIQLRSTTDKYFLLSKTAALLWMVKLNCFLLAPLYNLEDSILFFSPS